MNARVAGRKLARTTSLAVLIAVCFASSQLRAQEAAQTVSQPQTAEQVEPAALAEPEDSLESEPMNFREGFRKNLHSFDVSVGAIVQHELPSGPRSDFDGERLSVAWRRFTEPRVEKGLELSLSNLENHTQTVKAWELMYARRQFFRVRPSYALNWSVGAGLCHLTDLCNEAGAHTNFVEQVGVGVMRRAGNRSAFTAEYRFTHISNASRRDPNIGLNCSIFTLGWRLHY